MNRTMNTHKNVQEVVLPEMDIFHSRTLSLDISYSSQFVSAHHFDQIRSKCTAPFFFLCALHGQRLNQTRVKIYFSLHDTTIVRRSSIIDCPKSLKITSSPRTPF
uniref:Uncharacterized protein n=1 Tax=Ditylum brightwellii TaxID=49249 RepID=A0A6U3UM99_9STRA